MPAKRKLENTDVYLMLQLSFMSHCHTLLCCSSEQIEDEPDTNNRDHSKEDWTFR